MTPRLVLAALLPFHGRAAGVLTRVTGSQVGGDADARMLSYFAGS